LATDLSASIPSAGIEAELYIPTGANMYACDNITFEEGGLAKGKIAFVSRGSCAFQTKGESAQDAGAAALVVYDDQGQTLADQLDMLGSAVLDIVVEGLTRIEGELVISLTDKYGNLTVKIFQAEANATQRAALVDLYESCGGASWSYSGTTYTAWVGDTDPCLDNWVWSSREREKRERDR
jgi:PA domain